MQQLLNPPAIVREAVNLEAAIARLKELAERRKKDAVEIGRIFCEIRTAYPDVKSNSTNPNLKTYSPQLISAISASGYHPRAAASYMSRYRSPEINARAVAPGRFRVRILKEMLDMLNNAADLDAAIEAIQ